MPETVIKVAEHFWRIEESGVRMFLFEGKERAMLVDTGFGTLPLKEIVSGLTPLPVFVVNTHTDGDHTACNNDFDILYMHPSEMDYYVWHGRKAGEREPKLMPLWEGDVIDLDYWKFEVLLTPGHTPGSIMLLEREKRMLVSGDTIQNGEIYMFGQGRNLPALMVTLEKLDRMKDDFDVIWPSHSDCPLTPDIIPGLIRGAQALAAGELTAQAPDRDMPCQKYRCDVAAFLYNDGK